jgi:hypothetical protein
LYSDLTIILPIKFDHFATVIGMSAPGNEEEEEEKEVSFHELGLDEQLKRALRKKGIAKATPIQQEAIPLILVRDFCLLFSFCLGAFFVSCEFSPDVRPL